MKFKHLNFSDCRDLNENYTKLKRKQNIDTTCNDTKTSKLK